MRWLKGQRTNIYVAACGVAVVVSLAYLAMPQGHIPMLDANRWVLAETELQGYCAGFVFVESGGQNERDARKAKSCRVEKADVYVDRFDLDAVITGFCAAINEGFGMDPDECRGITAQNRIWPLYDGGFTTDWNETWVYPGDESLARRPVDGRVGDRETIEREENER